MRNKKDTGNRSETSCTKQNTTTGNENIISHLIKTKHQNVVNIKSKQKTNTENNRLFHHPFSEWNSKNRKLKVQRLTPNTD